MKNALNLNKILKKLTLCFMWVVLGISFIKAQPCQTKFDHYKNGKNIVFVNKSRMPIGIGNFSWNFGDGTPWTKNNEFQFSHLYALPGTYLVCLMDTTCPNNPMFCDSVVASNTKALTAYFTHESYGNGVFIFSDSSIRSNAPIIAYQWDFGDGSFAHDSVAKHNYHASGTYHVSLTVLDSANNYDIYYDTVEATVTTPCYAEFKYEYVNNQFQFYNLSLSPDTTISYTWNFGDGSAPSNMLNPIHTYPTSNNYLVTLVMTGSTCNDSIKKTIYMPDTTICNLNFNTVINYQKVTFTVSSTNTEPLFEKYLIEYGDFNTSYMLDSTKTYIYQDTGTYKVCVSSLINLCGVEIKRCKNIRIDNLTTYCVADFEIYSETYRAAFYNSSVTYGTTVPSTVNIRWGDGTSYTGIDSGFFTHEYAAEGPYNVTLVITNPTGCSDSITKVISVGPNYIMSGQITHDSFPAYYASVKVYMYDSLSGLLFHQVTTNTDEYGNYSVKLKKGYYLVQADFTFDPFNTGYYLPTYYKNKLNWDLADVIFLNGDRSDIDIALIPYSTDTSGNGNIVGYVRYGTGVVDQNGPIPAGKPAEKMLLYLKDDMGRVVSYTHTAKDGTFEFENVQRGNYMVWGEMAGKVTIPPTIILSNNNSTVSGVKIIIGKNALSSTPENESIERALPNFALYPNPTSGRVTIEWKIIQNKPASVEVFDMMGKMVVQQNAIDSDLNTSIDLSELTNGMYLLKINSADGQSVLKRIMKQD